MVSSVGMNKDKQALKRRVKRNIESLKARTRTKSQRSWKRLTRTDPGNYESHPARPRRADASTATAAPASAGRRPGTSTAGTSTPPDNLKTKVNFSHIKRILDDDALQRTDPSCGENRRRGREAPAVALSRRPRAVTRLRPPPATPWQT